MPIIRNSAFILGCRASGKTSFLTGLSILSSASKESSFGMLANDERTARYINDLKKYAAGCVWPPGTSDMVPLDFNVIYKHRTFALSLLDYPGEDLLEAMETMNYEQKELIREHIAKANIILLLLDPTQDLVSPINADSVMSHRRQNALAAAVGKLALMRQEDGLELPIVGLIISKSDLLDDGSFDRIRMDNEVLFEKLSQYARTPALSCFRLSASGPVADAPDEVKRSYPRNPEPKGFEELFSWLGMQVDLRRNRRLISWAVGVALSIGVLVVGWKTYASLAARKVASLVAVETVDNVSKLVNKPRIPKIVAKALDARAGEKLNELRAASRDLKFLEDIQRLVDELSKWKDMPHVSQRKQFKDLLNQLADRENTVRYNGIRNAQSSGDHEAVLEQITNYEKRFPTGGMHDTEVQKIKTEVLGNRNARLRREIQGIPINSRDSLGIKGKKIGDYLTINPNEPKFNEIQMARDVCARLSAADSVKIELKACGYKGDSSRKHEIRWFIRNNPVATHTSSAKGHNSTFEGKTLEVSNRDWANVFVKFYVNDGWVRTKWEKTSQKPMGLLQNLHRLDGKQEIVIGQNEEEWENVESWLRAVVLVPTSQAVGFEPLSDTQLKAYADYVYPGNRW